MLLSPERGLALSASATEIVQLCDGTRTASDITSVCIERYGAGDAARITLDVNRMIQELMTRGLVVPVAGG